MRGLKKLHWEGTTYNIHMDIATTRPTRPRGAELVKTVTFLFAMSLSEGVGQLLPKMLWFWSCANQAPHCCIKGVIWVFEVFRVFSLATHGDEI